MGGSWSVVGDGAGESHKQSQYWCRRLAMKPKLQLQTLPIHCQSEYFLDVVWLLGVLQDEGKESEILPRTV